MPQAFDVPHPPSPASAAHPDSALSGGAPGASRVIRIGQTVADVERHLILDTLGYCGGNRTHAAKILGISIRTLRNKLNDYAEAGFSVPEPGQPRGGMTC